MGSHQRQVASLRFSTIKFVDFVRKAVLTSVLLLLAGIYLDLDVIVLNRFTPLKRFNTTLGAESPNSLGNGVIVAVPNSTFLWLVYLNYYSFDDRKWNYHSVRMPMKLATLYPDIIHIEWDSMLRPSWAETRYECNSTCKSVFIKISTMYIVLII